MLESKVVTSRQATNERDSSPTAIAIRVFWSPNRDIRAASTCQRSSGPASDRRRNVEDQQSTVLEGVSHRWISNEGTNKRFPRHLSDEKTSTLENGIVVKEDSHRGSANTRHNSAHVTARKRER